MSSWKRSSFLFSFSTPIRPPSQAPNSVATPHSATIHEPRDVRERAEVVEQDAADDAGEQADRGAEESVADDVERLEIVGGVDVPLLEAGLVLGDHVHEEVVDAHVVQVVGDPRGALELGRDVIQALHRFPSSIAAICGENAESGQHLSLAQPPGLWKPIGLDRAV